MPNWVSTKQATELLGVGATTVKRWADDGLLPFYRTAGGHRRFELATVRELAANEEDDNGRFAEAELREWFDALLGDDHDRLAARLRELVERRGDWYAAADFMAAVAQHGGRRWADRECSVVECNLASSRLLRLCCAEATAMTVPENSPRCLVASVAGDRHNVGPALAELCLRSRALDAFALHDELAAEHLASYLPGSGLDLVVLSASGWQSDALSLGRYYRDIAEICERENIRIVLGGDGAWPVDPDQACRCHTFNDLRAAINQMAAR